MRYTFFGVIVLVALFGKAAYGGQFISGSTGADGAFAPTANVTLTVPVDGIFNFTTVNIPAGVTVKFQRNVSNTPIYVLATGDITIAGIININGETGSGITQGQGGPGGFDGGLGGLHNVLGSKGIGPGGGNPQGEGCTGSVYGGAGGKFAESYGNEKLIPMIGGSGGGGGRGDSSGTGGSGGGGGGAILIASSKTVNITGTIMANGGAGAGGTFSGGGGGSGGAIKLMADTVSSSGNLTAVGGKEGAGVGQCCPYSCYPAKGTAGGSGRIRIEANTLSSISAATPSYSYGYPASVFVAGIPDIRIISIGGISVPSSPSGSFATPDISLPVNTANPVTLSLAASNIPTGTIITVSVIPQFGSATNVISTPLSGTNTSSTATANVNLSNSYPYIITATAFFTVQTAMYYEGEKIDKVRVVSVAGKESDVIYITETGKKITKDRLFARISN